MFTGLVEEVGEVREVVAHADVVRLVITGPVVAADTRHGDSIAVNGVCLTVVEVAGADFHVELVPETLRRSSLAGVAAGARVNLERAMSSGQRFGGHIMQGHVDGGGTVAAVREDGFARVVTIRAADPQLLRYVVEKGSIAVDGVSLTVARVDDESFDVSLIPETLERTTLGEAAVGRPVNLEVDVFAKYVEKLVVARVDA